MGWIVSVVFALTVSSVIFFVSRLLSASRYASERQAGSILRVVSFAVFGLWVGGHTLLASINTVPAGNIGVVYRFGAIVGQVTEGLTFVAPWKSVSLANIQVQSHRFNKNELASFSAETQDVFVEATLNIRVSPSTIQELYRSVGPSYFDILIRPRVAQNFKDETVKFKSVDIAPNRETIRTNVTSRLKVELSNYSIEVVDLLLDNIDFRPEFKTSIENKQIATQNALEEEQRVQVSKYKAEQQIKQAEGEGGAILAVAEKQAEANTKLSASLTPELVQYALIQKLGDQIKGMILPAGQNFILDPRSLEQK